MSNKLSMTILGLCLLAQSAFNSPGQEGADTQAPSLTWKQLRQLQDAYNPFTAFPPELQARNVGAGIIRAFHTEKGLFVLLSKRFDGKDKLSAGGSAGHKASAFEAIQDRLAHESFGQLPVAMDTGYWTTEKHVGGGATPKAEEIKAWGPYFTLFGIQKMDHATLEEKVATMNAHAAAHFPVGGFLQDVSENKLDLAAIEAKAASLLEGFAHIQVKPDPLVLQTLKNLQQGNCEPPLIPGRNTANDASTKRWKDLIALATNYYTKTQSFKIVAFDELIISNGLEGEADSIAGFKTFVQQYRQRGQQQVGNG